MLEINYTLGVQVITYLLLLYAFHQLLFKPVMAVFEERKKRTAGAVEEAGKIEKEVEGGIADYEKRLKEETIKAQEGRARIRQSAVKKEQELLDKARKAAATELAKISTELGESKKSAMEALKKDARELSRTLAEKVLDRKLAAFLLPLLLIPIIPDMALASSDANGSWLDTFGGGWKVANFFFFVAVFYLLWRKYGRPMLESRGADIAGAINEAEDAKKAAEELKSEYEAKLAMLDEKVSKIRAELESEAEEEKKRILVDAEKAVLKIKAQAKAAAEQELKKAKLELRDEAGRLAVKLAEDILTKELKDSDQKKLVKGYIDSLDLNN